MRFLADADSSADSVYSRGMPECNHQSRDAICPLRDAPSIASAIEEVNEFISLLVNESTKGSDERLLAGSFYILSNFFEITSKH